MNRSQYLPYTAYTTTPYLHQFGAPGYYSNAPAIPPPGLGSSAQLAYPPPTYGSVSPQAHQNLSAWPYGGGVGGYTPMPGQVEDIVSPGSSSAGNMPTPIHPTGSGRSGINTSGLHPSHLPQVQDVFAPRQPGTLPMPPHHVTQMPNGTSRMVGAYPPTNQGSSPTTSAATIALPQRPVDPAVILARPGMKRGYPPPQGPPAGFGQAHQSVFMGAGAEQMGLGVGMAMSPIGAGSGSQGGSTGTYRHFSLSP